METNIIYVHGCFECPYLNQTKDIEGGNLIECKKRCFSASKNICGEEEYRKTIEIVKNFETHPNCTLLYSERNERELKDFQLRNELDDEVTALLNFSFQNNGYGYEFFNDWTKNEVLIMDMEQLGKKLTEIDKQFQKEMHDAIDVEHIDIGINQELGLQLICDEIGIDTTYIGAFNNKGESIIVFYQDSFKLYIRE